MINKVVLVGRLTRDPELKFTNSGVPVIRFTLAVNRNYTNQNGDREADFINCVAWRKAAEIITKYAGKGSMLAVDGRLQTGKYENQEGQTIYTTDVITENFQFVGGNGGNNEQKGKRSNIKKFIDPFADDGEPLDISDEDLPF